MSAQAGDSTERFGARRPGSPTRRQALDGIARELEAAGTDSPRVEAERLLALVTGVSRGQLQLSLGSPLTAVEAGRLAEAVRRRLTGEPLQHIEGNVEFRGVLLAADSRAFVPRPETEQLVELILEWARERARSASSRTAGSAPRGPSRSEAAEGVRTVRRPAERRPLVEAALDIGTGSGAIALALADERIAGRIIALDRSRAALEQAEENRRRAGQAERVELRHVEGAIWDAVRDGERFDLIVSNPPYVSAAEMDRLPPEVRHDPAEALEGGEDGLDVIREILSGAREHLKPRGALFLEIGERQGARLGDLLTASGDWARRAVRRDLAGRVRFAVAERD